MTAESVDEESVDAESVDEEVTDESTAVVVESEEVEAALSDVEVAEYAAALDPLLLLFPFEDLEAPCAAFFAAATDEGELASFQLDPLGTTVFLPTSSPEKPRSSELMSPSLPTRPL